MSISRIFLLAIAAWLAASSTAGAQVPADLRAAMLARDTAFYAVDSAQWEKFTRPDVYHGAAGWVVPDQSRTACQPADPDAAALRPAFARAE